MLANVAARIPEDHPNREALRRRLSLSKNRLRRNLISPEQHEQTQAQHRQMATRNDRKDWKPSAEGQKQMDKRHKEQDRQLMDKYRRPAA